MLHSLLTLLTTFHGRISRKQWWIGFLLITAIELPVATYLNPNYFSSGVLPQPVWAETLWSTFWIIPTTAITVKRFNDRDWPWWFGYAAAAALLYAGFAPHFGVPVDPDAAAPYAIAFWVVLAIFVAALIDNGFRRGTAGRNRYGDDPLAYSEVAVVAA